jgi:hypothetical protein
METEQVASTRTTLSNTSRALHHHIEPVLAILVKLCDLYINNNNNNNKKDTGKFIS